MSTTESNGAFEFNPSIGSYKPSLFLSSHSKLLLVDKETVTIMSFVSLPVIVIGDVNLPTTMH